MLMRTSLRAPLDPGGMHLYETIFRSAFGKLPFEGAPTPEPWQGATAERLAEARKKLARDRRGAS